MDVDAAKKILDYGRDVELTLRLEVSCGAKIEVSGRVRPQGSNLPSRRCRALLLDPRKTRVHVQFVLPPAINQGVTE